MRSTVFKLLAICLFLGFATQIQAQDSAKYSLQLLAPEMIMTPNLDVEGLGDWFGEVTDIMDPLFVGADQPKRVVAVLATFHPKGAPTVALGANPKLENAQQESIMASLQKVTAYNTKLYDFSMLVWVQVGGAEIGTLEAMKPAMESPEEKRRLTYEAMDLKGKAAAMQQFAREELIPAAAYHLGESDAKFAGVRAVGQILDDGDYAGGKVEAVTSQNFDYWRGTVEMQAAIQIIPFSKMAMLISEGQFGWAERYFLLIKLFSDKTSLPALYRPTLEFMFDRFNADLESQVNIGIALHDEGKYAEAVTHYKALLQFIPKTAWIKYELYYSEDALAVKGGADPGARWAAARPTVYACDPLYPMDAKASSGREGYLLYQRMRLNELFKTKGQMRKDLVEYADIALTLGEYGYAAQLYWLFSLHFDKADYENRNMIAYFLYSLDKLGVQGMASNFEGNFEKEFKKIDDKLKKEMEANAMYKSFESK